MLWNRLKKEYRSGLKDNCISGKMIDKEQFTMLLTHLGYFDIDSTSYKTLTKSMFETLCNTDQMVNVQNVLIFLAAVQNVEIPLDDAVYVNEEYDFS